MNMHMHMNTDNFTGTYYSLFKLKNNKIRRLYLQRCFCIYYPLYFLHLLDNSQPCKLMERKHNMNDKFH